MSVPSSKALQEQLSAVLGALTKAALAEICLLVEEGYSVLQLEISRSHKENQDLRKKLHLIESIVVRGGGENQAPAAAPEEEEKTEAAEAAFHPETPHREREDAAAGPGGDGGSAGVEREEVPEVVLIKDEDSDGHDSMEDGERKLCNGGAPAVSDGVPSARTTRRRRRHSRAYEDAETSALKASKQNVPVYSVDSPGVSPPLPEDDVQLVQDCSLSPAGPSRQVFYSGGGTLMEAPSSTRAELDMDPAWTKQHKGPMSFSHFCPGENMEGDAFGLKLVGVSGSTSADARSSAFEYENGGGVMNFGLYGDPPAEPDADPQRKRFVCSICSRTYATAQNLEVHNRIHTGERPFACEQCGKKFTQSAHLRSHLNVHTGARPYGCTLCPRSFIVKYSLKLHMKKCHPTN